MKINSVNIIKIGFSFINENYKEFLKYIAITFYVSHKAQAMFSYR